MKLSDIITESRQPTDAEMRMRGWDDDTDDSGFKPDWSVGGAPSPVGFSVLNTVRNILGSDNVCTEEDKYTPGQYYVFAGHRGWFTDLEGEGSSIELPCDLFSNAAVDIATAAHEAYHAWLHNRSRGKVYTNEKMVNQLATKWLKKHLTGVNLHVALERILKSKISYGHN